MIVADFSREREGLRLILKGHAGYAYEGGDIVCSAVSALFYALCGYLKNTIDEGLVIHSMKSGEGEVECTLAGEEAMRFTYIGLLQIMLAYPENLAVVNRAFDYSSPDAKAR